MNQALREWMAPAVASAAILAVITWQLDGIRDRFTSVEARIGTAERAAEGVDTKLDRRGEAIERRVVETNQRIDRILEQQTSIAQQISRAEVELNYIRTRLDRVAERLQVSAAPADMPTASGGMTVPPRSQSAPAHTGPGSGGAMQLGPFKPEQ